MNLYVHVPFCHGKCDYCAFYSEPVFDPQLWIRYLEKLKRDLDLFSHDSPVRTLYFGGGTPTLPDAPEIEKLLTIFRSRFEFAPDAEITMECNPETMNAEKASVMTRLVNRVSMGAQSFSPDLLATIGRTSLDPKAVFRAFEMLRAAGIANIGLDLMYALPGETMDMLESDLKTALSLKPAHISAYSLTLEEQTPLAEKRNLGIPSDDLAADMWERIGTFLASTHPRYEISNYAPLDRECRHNQNVWHGEPYFGFGPAASSFDGTIRKTEVSDLRRWLAGEPAELDEIPRRERIAEILMMGLRTVRGWREDEFMRAAGVSWDIFPSAAELVSMELLERCRNILRPTQRGLACWNAIAEELLDDSMRI